MSYNETGFTVFTAKALQQVFRHFSPWHAQAERHTRVMILDFSMLASGICHVLIVKPYPHRVTPFEHGTSHSVPVLGMVGVF